MVKNTFWFTGAFLAVFVLSYLASVVLQMSGDGVPVTVNGTTYVVQVGAR